MKLTKLEIKGFKSFGDRVVINFDKGITGIVGPNGCGKSNVVDSIRWVLGEQRTRNLRSEKMENIIFNGTRKRKPTNLAEVSITFENTRNLLPTEYTSVTITRRYYRSGESEYLLNGVTCRLKDITDLFMDTGIASNSYAIIELKMVDEILQDKDNSRRGLFEEAAGIAKFRTRKKETMKKLADTDADLERVEDLLYEIEKNMRSLERQAKQTQRYFKIKEEYKVLSIALAVRTMEELTHALERSQKQLAEEEERKIALAAQIAEKDAGIQAQKKGMVDKEKILASRQKALNEYVSNIRQYESDKKIKNERLRFLNDKVAGLQEQISQDKQSRERAEFSISSLSKELEGAEKIFREMEARIDELKADYEEQKAKTQGIKEEAEEVNRQFRTKQDAAFQLDKSVELKQMQLSGLKQELEKTAVDTTEQRGSLEEFEGKMNDLKAELDEKRGELDGLKQKELKLQERIESTEKTIEMIREELTQTNRKLDARRNEFQLTKSLVDNLEGFPEAIKFLKKSAKWAEDAPLLSDILTTEEEYRVAIENFLEPFMNYYIVETEAQAYQAVNLLSDASKGKAHFFVLDRFEKYNPEPPRVMGDAIPATEIVEYDSKYRKLITYILDNVYLVRSDDDALPENDEATFITLSGKFTRRRFSIHGGSVGLFEGKRIGRAKNLKKLEEQIEELTTKRDGIRRTLEENQKALTKAKDSTRKRDIETLQQEINRINEAYISTKTKQEQLAQLINSAANKREDIEERLTQLNEELMDEAPRAKLEREALQDLEYRTQELQNKLETENEWLSQKSSTYNQENILFHQQQNRVQSIEQEVGYKRNSLENSQERITNNQEELEKTETEVRTLLENGEESEDELLEMYQEKERIEAGVNEAEKEYYQSRGDIDLLEEGRRELQRKRESGDQLIMELQNSRNEAKMRVTSVKDRLSVEFEVDLDNLQEEPDPIHMTKTEPELREEVQTIKGKLEKIGPINPMAMEAYQEIKERHDFIIEQKKDLVEAKESLVSTISEIDAVAKETFLEAYHKIKENFVVVFRSLFTEEDECDLILTDPENPLDSKIEIIAKPKGKRPLTINQLSGGEKTLTATSLLFSIYLLKPAPFCIFDEVDAPLDDANIDKFNNIIKKFSNESQFVIVTHNKRTMASTDVIYGITMIEQGVSRAVPVDLRELEDQYE
ncbi:MAG TPA: chromosome segregation protein SMC [Cytophagales bacterium]|nr:chromosome segregation protein SMC [Cytophagales bacterium]HAP58156.1 chromosome segregation protein SMC [Cytophagales bacterium]